ncbi:MAG: ferrochelatase [Hyphomicrobiales bacterium]
MTTRDVRLPSDHPSVRLGNIGVLLMNLGTPDATSYWPMRRYLKEFLSDRRVIEVNPVAWWFILNGLVLTRRPQRSGHAYERIWNRELNESPLRTITRAQADKLSAAMAGEPRVRVDWAMRYGTPAIGPAIERLKDQGCDRILLFPLYPQYSAATVATAYDKAFDHLKTMRWQPAVRAVPPYHDHPAYIDALARSVRTHMEGLEWKPDVIVASFHGLPEASLTKGDPYHCHCQKTTRLLRNALALPDDKLVIAFQSRFGRAEWLKPYTDDKVAELARGGAKNLLAITPGFSADCVETLEEIDIGTREVFMANGGENFSLVPCLNDSAPSVAMLNDIVRRELLGWL